MASFQTLANGKIQARIRKKGHLASEVFETLKMAEAWAKREETRIDKAEAGIFEDDSKITMSELILKWAEVKKGELKGFAQVQYHLKTIPNYILMARVKTMSSKIFDRYMAEEKGKRAEATIHRRLDQLRAIVNWGIRKIPSLQRIHNVITDIDKPKLPASNSRDRVATPKEIEQVIKNTKSKFFPDFLRLLNETAARVSELAGLRWEHVNYKAMTARIFNTKNGEDRDLLLTDKAIEILQKMEAVKKSDWVFPSPKFKDRPIGGNAATSAMVKARKKIEKATGKKMNLQTHDIRHTAATRMGDVLNILELKDALGHKDIKSTSRYFNKKMTDIAQKLKTATEKQK